MGLVKKGFTTFNNKKNLLDFHLLSKLLKFLSICKIYSPNIVARKPSLTYFLPIAEEFCVCIIFFFFKNQNILIYFSCPDALQNYSLLLLSLFPWFNFPACLFISLSLSFLPPPLLFLCPSSCFLFPHTLSLFYFACLYFVFFLFFFSIILSLSLLYSLSACIFTCLLLSHFPDCENQNDNQCFICLTPPPIIKQ